MTEQTLTIEEYRAWTQAAKAVVADWTKAGKPSVGYHCCGVEVSEQTFHQGTRGAFALCDMPSGEPDYRSDSGSCYWYRDGGVVRVADHWSGTECQHLGGSRCFWTISGDRNRGDQVAGFCRFADMTDAGGIFYTDLVSYAGRLMAGIDRDTWYAAQKASEKAAKAERKAAREAKAEAAKAEARRAARAAKNERRLARHIASQPA